MLDNLFKLLMINTELPEGRNTYQVLHVVDLKFYYSLFSQFKVTTLQWHKDVDMTKGIKYQIEKSLHNED